MRQASTSAFLRGLTIGCLIAGAVAAAGALLAALFLPAQPARPASQAAGEAGTAEGRTDHPPPRYRITHRLRDDVDAAVANPQAEPTACDGSESWTLE